MTPIRLLSMGEWKGDTNPQGRTSGVSGLAGRAAAHLEFLCRELSERCVGSAGNRAATAWFARQASELGFRVRMPEFDCIEWEQDGAHLALRGRVLEVQPSPYTLGCDAGGRLTVVDTLEALQQADLEGSILLIRGGLARRQLMPKNFPFYNPEEDQQIIALLERKAPAAILAATGRDPDMAGGVSPFPWIEDGDFGIPCAHLTEAAGRELAAEDGAMVQLTIRAGRSPARACNVEARAGPSTDERIVVCAHIDAKRGTPGALDNAAGVATLLLLAELLPMPSLPVEVELVALNGEDYYSAPGEQLYLRQHAGRFERILLGINIDGAGDRLGKTAFSLYGCPAGLADVIRQAFMARPDMIEGDPWYQSDHSLFLMHDRPALAVTSARFTELWSEVAHTDRDLPDLVSPAKLEQLALALRDVVMGAGNLASFAGGRHDA